MPCCRTAWSRRCEIAPPTIRSHTARWWSTRSSITSTRCGPSSTADKGDEERRKKLGLPPRRRRQPRLGDDELERRVQVGLYMPTQAIEVIEQAAGEFGISWSYLVSLLLDRELARGGR